VLFVCYAEIDVVEPKIEKCFVDIPLYSIKVPKVESCLMPMLVGNVHVLSVIVNIEELCALGENLVHNVTNQRPCSKTSCHES
jgi:hypothetical protein